MAVRVQIEQESFSLRVGYVTLSGTVDVDDIFVERRMDLYKNGEFISYTTSSAVDGTFSFTTNGSTTDRFMVIKIGTETDNSQVYDYIDMVD